MTKNNIKDIATNPNSEVAKMTTKKAYAYIKESKSLIEQFRPIESEIEEYPINMPKNIFLSMTNGIILVSGAGGVVTSLVTGSIPFLIVSLSSVILAIISFVLSFYTHSGHYYGYPNQKFGKLISHLYMNKKQRKWIDKYQSLKKSNKQAQEAHQLLISKAFQELDRKEVFKVLNDPSNEELGKFVFADQTTGEFKWVERTEHERMQRNQIASNPELVARAILEKVAENKDLFD